MSSRYSELSKGIVSYKGNLYLAQYYIMKYDIIEFIDPFSVHESDEEADIETTGVMV